MPVLSAVRILEVMRNSATWFLARANSGKASWCARADGDKKMEGWKGQEGAE